MAEVNSNKIIYREWCKEKENLPLFFRPFWLDLVCGKDQWKVLIATHENGEIAGVMPYFMTKRYGLKVIQNPPVTPFSGFLLDYPNDVIQSGKLATKYHFELKTLKQLVEKIPPYFYFSNNCLPQLTNALPFYWADYNYLTFYTYVILDVSNIEKVQANFNRNIRRNLRKSEKNLIIEKTIDTNLFFDIHKMTFDRQNIPVPFTKPFFEKLDKGILENQAGQKFAAKDADGNVHSVAYLLWDNERAYYYLAGENPTFRGSGASIFLIWEAIKFTQVELGLSIFDFAGSMIKNVEVIRRQFGATQIPYFHIYKSRNRWVEMLVTLLKKRM